NTYEWTSFDFGPTLLAWLVPHAPEVLAALRRADRASRVRTGHGNAWAQAYGHAILPLSTARDVRTQVLWGRADFAHRFGRSPEGMWLPEMAVDRPSLAALAEAGIGAPALDGETYGHHHRAGALALAAAVVALRDDPAVALAGPAAFRARHPAAHEVEIAERTSWSCAHGVERWRADCGCRVGGEAGWSPAWRAPLREAVDWLRDQLAVVYETHAGECLRDPWGARDRWVECLLAPERSAGWLEAEASAALTAAAGARVRDLLALARHALLLQTSCGWFFDELTGLEPLLVLRHAARAIELARGVGAHLEDGFVTRLASARGNTGETGAALYHRLARGGEDA